MTGEELEAIVGRCLEEGVPPEVISRVFDLDSELVKEAQHHFRVREYDTDDLSGYIEALRWATVKDAFRVLESGSSADRARLHDKILGKEMAVSARRTPESVRNATSVVMDLMEEMKNGRPRDDAPKSKFIARLDDTGTDA